MKICTKCKIEKDLSEFRKKKTCKDGLNNVCKTCCREYGKDHYKSNKDKYIKKSKKWREDEILKFIEFLKDKSCKDCGESDIRVLEFDHLRNKSFNISKKIGVLTFNKLYEEIKKCDIVCSNCHKKRTSKQFNWFKNRI